MRKHQKFSAFRKAKLNTSKKIAIKGRIKNHNSKIKKHKRHI